MISTSESWTTLAHTLMGKAGRNLWVFYISDSSPVKQLPWLVLELSVFLGCLQKCNYAVITATPTPLI